MIHPIPLKSVTIAYIIVHAKILQHGLNRHRLLCNLKRFGLIADFSKFSKVEINVDLLINRRFQEYQCQDHLDIDGKDLTVAGLELDSRHLCAE